MITSIQLHKDIKFQLKSMKKPKESYEEVISRLIADNELTEKRKEEKLIQEYSEMNEEFTEEIKQITEDFKYADAELVWEW